MKFIALTLFFIISIPLLSQEKDISCDQKDNKLKNVLNGLWFKKQGCSETGHASWYGPGFHGKKTACGQIYNQNQLTAAHKTLPCGTRVKVTNKKNGRSVVVTINDRGPYIPGRIIDLSKAAASRIGMSGTAGVCLKILK